MELRAPRGTFNLASIGPREMILRDPCEIDAGSHAEIVLFVDGEEFRWRVFLPQGAVPFSPEVYFQPQGVMVRTKSQDKPTGLHFSA
jgi:hypothetical protein